MHVPENQSNFEQSESSIQMPIFLLVENLLIFIAHLIMMQKSTFKIKRSLVFNQTFKLS
jgi:hypothetical protein